MFGKHLRLVRDNPEAQRPPMAALAEEAPGDLPRFLLRQAVLDAEGRVLGHELRMRDRVPLPVQDSGDPADLRDERLLRSVLDLAERQGLGRRLVFLPLGADALFRPEVERLPRGNAVLSFTPGGPLAELAERCRDLAEQGVILALDGVPDSEAEALLPHCRYLRIDASGYDALALGQLLDRLGQSPGSPETIALNVDTEETFEACRRLEFSLFQGHHFTRPRAAGGRRLDSSRLKVMELLNLVNERAEIPVLEESFKRDASLSYKLLRFINSPAIGLRQPIQSIAHALIILGHNPLYRWLTLLLFVGGEPDARAQALMRSALVRARFTENLGREHLRPEQRGGLFIVGVLSLLDALLDQPMDAALAGLKLPGDIAEALLERRGPYAPFLELAIACENFDQDSVERLASAHGLDAEAVNLAHIDALIWSEGLDI